MKSIIALALLLVSETQAISKAAVQHGKFEQDLISMGMSSGSSEEDVDVAEDDDYEAIQL